jgi:hypothetical protein
LNLFQGILGPLLALAGTICLVQTLRRRMTRRAGLAWSLLWFGAAAFVFDPLLSSRIARLFGIGRGADFALYVGVIVAWFVAWMLFLRTRRLENTITELVRLRALDEARLGTGPAPLPPGDTKPKT